ncbi:MAG: glycosyltransferase family 2 protein [Lachnospiraceae bacterium]|nr:glycosyltransferase family 2 protein [Lachnospiraceae bacterium]
MISLTVMIITKDEEQNIGKCLKSLTGLPERVVIVDSCSTDGTEAVCRGYGRRFERYGGKLDFYTREWKGYSDQLNWAINETGIDTDWVMRLDADETVTPELRKELIKRLPREKKDVTGIVLKRRVYFMGRWIRHGGRYPEKLMRVFRNGHGKCEDRLMDEHLITDGKIREYRNDIIDCNEKSLSWWISKHNRYSDLEAQSYFLDSGNEDLSGAGAQTGRKKVLKGWYYRLPPFFRAMVYFNYRYFIKGGFLDGTEGLIFHFLQAFWYRFLVDSKIWEQTHRS